MASDADMCIVPQKEEVRKLSEQINRKSCRGCKQVAGLVVTCEKCETLIYFRCAKKNNKIL